MDRNELNRLMYRYAPIAGQAALALIAIFIGLFALFRAVFQ